MKKPKRKLLITITGTPGSGKGTVAKLLSKKYQAPHYSIGDIFRRIARAKGMTLVDYIKWGESHPSVDLAPDRWAARQSKKTRLGIYDGRTMFLFVKPSYKIFLKCSLAAGAQRITGDSHVKRRYEADLTNLRQATAALKRRIASDRKRYLKLYHVDFYDRKHYDLVVDTTKLTPNQVLQRIVKFISSTPAPSKLKKPANLRKSI
jgi:cytidylate kinase